MIESIRQIMRNKRLVKYFIMAVIVVCIELISFQIIYLLSLNYYFATILSFIIGLVLNWVLGRIYVFGASEHHPAKEFTMVLATSIAGATIQIIVVAFSVNVVGLYPFIGKVISILFSFVWNYWFRSRYIYKISN